MKKLYFLTFLFLCTFLTIGTNTAWGETETITFTNKDWSPWTNITSGSSFESSNLARGVANNGVSGSCKSPKMYNNITKIELVCSSNTTGGSVAVLVGTSQVGSQEILKSNNATYTYTVSDLSGLVTIKVGKPSSKSVWVKSIAITYETSTSSCTQLSTPTNLAVKNITSSTADISWDAVPNATKYKVTCIGDDATIEKEVSTTSDQLTGLDASSQYLWSVKAIGDGTTYCDSEESETKDFTTLASSAPCTQLPAPTELNASATTYNAATLSWNKIENATKYQITTTPPMFGGSATYTTTGTETTYTATDLSPETEYKWTVKALGDGTTYCDSEKSASSTFTTPAKPTYTITWRTPDGPSTTKVTQGDKIGTLLDAPAAPQGCPDKVFMGWSENNIGTTGTNDAPAFISAETIPTANTIYYAVFATETKSSAGGSGSLDITISNFTEITTDYSKVYTHTYPAATVEAYGVYNNSKGIQMNKSKGTYIKNTTAFPGPITNITCTWSETGKNSPTLYVAKGGVASTSSTDLGKQFNTSQTQSIDISASEGYDYFYFDGTTVTGACYLTSLKITYGGGVTTTYTDYVTNCVDCTAPTTPLALSIADATLNLGEDGTAKTTFSTIGGNGAEIVYSLTPEVGSALSDDVLTFTQAGTYTLTAQQDLNTADGTTYCGSRVSQTITVTKNPVLYFTTTPSNPIEFPEVECGGNTPLSQKQQISLQGYNLTGDVAVAVTGDYKIARTASAALSDYTTEFTLPKTIAGKINATYSSVYVLSCPPAQSNSATNGTLTITTDKGNTLTVNLSTPTVTCDEYTLTLNDRGSKKEFGSYYAGAMVSQPADPTGVCTEPINYVFDGWATAEVANGSTTYTPVSFPYTMPKNNTTLYAVYRYTEIESNDFQIADADVDLEDGKDCILTAQSSNAEYALSSVTSTDVAGRMTTKEVAVDEDEAVAYKIQNVTDNTIIWTLEGNASDGYSFLNKSTGTYLTVVNGTLSMEASATTKYTISHPASDDWRVEVQRKGSSNYLSGYKAGEVLFSDYSKSTLNLYLYGRAYSYTTSPVCGPYIKATGDVAITSGKGIWVESVTPLTISAKNLDKNEDGENGQAAPVTITATVTDDASDKGFSIKTPGKQNSGAKSVTFVSDYTKATLDTALVVVYTPTDHDQVAEGKIALRVYKSGASATYATDTIVVRGRSLPTEFVLAAKTTNGWVALPSDLAVGSTGALKSPYAISVDNEAAPTKATEAPETAIWLADARSAVNKLATALRLKNANNQHLQGSKSEGATNVWLSNQNSDSTQSWELRSADFTRYFVRMHASRTGRYLSYDATQGKIGNYKQEASLHILPVEKTCVRFDAPKLKDPALASTYATLLWEEIAGVAEYEYSLDNGATWRTCTDVQTMGTAIQWTLSGLETETQYTVWVRAKVADGETNCSDYGSKTFTTTTCDDVPTDLWSSATANSVTVMWNAKAATATVKIYSDDKGENEVQSVPNLSSPAKIVGLAPNTKYYFQVLADGSCASAIDNFLTESNEVSIVEWEKEAVIVDINTDVSDADDVSILVENQTTHGSNNKNIADDLFFSKYYEAKANLKLVAIYNGTKEPISLSDTRIVFSKGAPWDSSKEILDLTPLKEIPSNTEYIFFSYTSLSSVTEGPAVGCIKESIGFNHSTWFPTNKFTADDLGVSLPFSSSLNLHISGDRSMALQRKVDGVWKFIDLFGAGDAESANNSKCVTVTDQVEVTLGDGSKVTTTMNDDVGWYCSEGTHYVTDAQIPLSTNRYLLIRKNSVHDGLRAVATNTTDFSTLCSEWEGAPCGKFKDADTDNETTCVNFAYVSDFNYNDYYTTYDSVAKLEIKGNRNADGTYTIPVPRMDTMACTNMRLQLKKAGVVIASREYKVPIVVNKSIDTKNATYFGGSKLTDEVCATCDVVVRDKARLEHVEGGKQQFREMYVYAGSTFTIPEGQKMTLDKVRMFATNDNVSYAVINNSNDAAAAISVKEVSHVKRIDGRYWYPFSLPYDCNIADIDQLSGQTLGVYGEDWGIKFYNGERRQSDGNSTTHYGEVSKYWTMMPENGVLKAYTGYIIGLFYPDENLMRSVNFPPANISAYTEDATSKTTPITNWPYNLTAQPRHHGWNFVGSPYISLFGAAENEGLYNAQVKMGWTDAYGEQQDKEHIYVSIPDGGNSNTYTQALASGVTIKPFTAYFVQAIDPTNNQSNTLQLTYSKDNRHLLASPARAAADASPLILAELDIRCGALHDNTGVLVSDDYSVDYEIGDDLTKMYAAAQKPQLYTIDAHNDKMAYQALPDVLAHAIPLGIYVPQAGNYTLSLNRYVSRLEAAEAVYLLHNGAVVANLLLSDYTVSASAKGTISGYSLDIRRAPEVVTDIVPAAGDAPYIIARDGVLAIANLPADAVVQVYDVLGHQLLRADTPATATLQVPVPQTGVYTVVITTANGQQVLKTLLR